MFDQYTDFRVVDQHLTPRGNLPTLADAWIYAAGFPRSTVEGWNYVLQCWVRFSVVGD